MPKTPNRPPTNLPLRHPLGEKIGAGKDNRVYPLLVPAETGTALGELVVKAGNQPGKGEIYNTELAVNDAHFKQEKYNLLQTFLGDFVPQSSFFVGSQRNPDGSVTTKPYTVQQRVPQYTLADLSPEQRNSDKLRGQMYQLATRLQTMHQVLNRARTIVQATGDTFLVDASLDLGTFSTYVKDHVNEDAAGFNYRQMVNGYKPSPNLLVNPETLQLHCIDFGKGEWSDKLGAQLAIVYDIATYDPNVHLPASVPHNVAAVEA